jgi:hypothetical protein
MDEATGITFTILLFFAAFLSSGAYGVLSLADFRAARRGFIGTAVSFAAIGVTLGVMTTWPLPIRVAVCAAFMALAGGGLIWALDYLKVRERLALNPVQATEPKRESPKIAEQRPISVLVECTPSPLPDIVPSAGYLTIVSPHRFGDNLTIPGGGRHGKPGDKWAWPDNWIEKWSTTTLRCQVTNYGDIPIFNVELPITVTFRKITRQPENPKNFEAKTVIGAQETVIPATKIDPGKDSPYVFYFHNQGLDLINIEFSKAPTYVMSGETTRREAQLMQPSGFSRFYSLWSVHDNEEIVRENEKIKEP